MKNCCESFKKQKTDFANRVDIYNKLCGGNPRMLTMFYDQLKEKGWPDDKIVTLAGIVCPKCKRSVM